MNKNAFKLSYPDVSIDGLSLNPREEKEIKLPLGLDGAESELDSFPYQIDCALKMMDDAYIFRVPCSMTVALMPRVEASVDVYKDLISNSQFIKRQEVV